MAHRPRILKSTPQRRKMLWITGTQVSTVLAAAGNTVLQTSLNAAALALAPFTVVRSRGMLTVFSDQTVASEFFSATYGRIVVQDTAVAAGVASIPPPATSGGSDFFVYEQVDGRVNITTNIGVTLYSFSREVDSKAMRKVDVGQDIAGLWELSPLSNGAQVISFVKTLVKLH